MNCDKESMYVRSWDWYTMQHVRVWRARTEVGTGTQCSMCECGEPEQKLGLVHNAACASVASQNRSWDWYTMQHVRVWRARTEVGTGKQCSMCECGEPEQKLGLVHNAACASVASQNRRSITSSTAAAHYTDHDPKPASFEVGPLTV